MRHVTNTITTNGNVERVRRNGREYLRFPIVPLKEMVLNYPESGTKEYLSAEKIARSAPNWDDAALVPSHPEDRGEGNTARVAEAFTEEVIGRTHDSEDLNDGEKLRTHGMVDVEKANAIGGIAEDVVDALEDAIDGNGDGLSVSAGYATVGDESTPGSFDGEDYDVEQGEIIPDHIAVWPTGDTGDGRRARCTPGEGCGAPKLNAEYIDSAISALDPEDVDDEQAASFGRRVLSHVPGFGGSGEVGSDETDEKHNHDGGDCGCGGECGECTDGERTNSEEETDDEANQEDTGESDMKDELRQRYIEGIDDSGAFDTDTLEEMEDGQIKAIAQGTDGVEVEAGGDGGDDDGDGDGGAGGTESTDMTDSTDSPDLPDGMTAVPEDEFNELREKVNTLEESEDERQETQREIQERIVLANMPDVDEDDVAAMGDETVEHFAEKYAGENPEQAAATAADGTGAAAAQKANYAGVAGAVERQNFADTGESEAEDDYPGTGREAFEKRNGGAADD